MLRVHLISTYLIPDVNIKIEKVALSAHSLLLFWCKSLQPLQKYHKRLQEQLFPIGTF